MSATKAIESVEPELGTKDFPRLARLYDAAGRMLLSYRNCPNYPELQSRKAAIWAEYQDVLRELDEAIHA